MVGDHLERAYRLQTELGMAGDATARLGEEAGTRLAAAGRRADTMGDPRRARFLLERALGLLPERSPERAAAMVELAAAGWNLLPRDELSRLLADGAELAAELGARAVELRARVLRLGAVPETSSDFVDERDVIVQANAALEELEAMDAPRAVATALCARAESEWWLGRAADARCVRAPCDRRAPRRRRGLGLGASRSSARLWSTRRCPSQRPRGSWPS